jgi:glycosyltransferase involved in cell wall biosynthesis
MPGETCFNKLSKKGVSEKIIVHISEVNISPSSGMGRVEYYWQRGFEKAGHTFIHIGPDEIGELKHKALFPYAAYIYFKKLNIKPDLFIVHEAAAGNFVNRGIPCFVESHGVERRGWEAILKGLIPFVDKVSLKTRLLFPLWRLRVCDKGLKNAEKLLLINSDDKQYVKAKYNRKDEDIYLFKNGIIHIAPEMLYNTDTNFTIVFNGSWISRKGTHVLIKAAEYIYKQKINVNYLLIGTSLTEEIVLGDWPEYLKPQVKVVPHFNPDTEVAFLNSASLFVLPSYAEGQPLSLLQAMEAGKCCITTNCCGQKDIIKNEVTGLLFEPGDYLKLAELIVRCHDDRILLQSIGENAKKYIDKYTWDVVSDELVDFVLKSI